MNTEKTLLGHLSHLCSKAENDLEFYAHHHQKGTRPFVENDHKLLFNKHKETCRHLPMTILKLDNIQINKRFVQEQVWMHIHNVRVQITDQVCT